MIAEASVVLRAVITPKHLRHGWVTPTGCPLARALVDAALAAKIPALCAHVSRETIDLHYHGPTGRRVMTARTPAAALAWFEPWDEGRTPPPAAIDVEFTLGDLP